MSKRRYSAVAVVFGATADRYVLQGYTEKRSFEQMLEDAKQVPGLTGIEVIGGWHINDENQHAVVKQIHDAGFELVFCDDGSPMPDAVASSLFLGPVSSESGYGIGLYHAARYAEAAGYRLELAENRAGRVCFRLAREL